MNILPLRMPRPAMMPLPTPPGATDYAVSTFKPITKASTPDERAASATRLTELMNSPSKAMRDVAANVARGLQISGLL